MGSQTLEILRQGVWASLTGGWFYDPHQDIFCNTFHLYIWLFLLCFPLTIYLYFDPTLFIWSLYCGTIALVFATIKAANLGLHHMYDTSECIQEPLDEDKQDNERRILKIQGRKSRREEEGIELKELPKRSSETPPVGCSSRNSFIEVEAPGGGTDLDSLNSSEYPRGSGEEVLCKPHSSTIDLKVDVHRKNSSESSEEVALRPVVEKVNVHRAEQCTQADHERIRHKHLESRPKSLRPRTDAISVSIENETKLKRPSLRKSTNQTSSTDSQEERGQVAASERPSLVAADSAPATSVSTTSVPLSAGRGTRRLSNVADSGACYSTPNIKPTGSLELGFNLELGDMTADNEKGLIYWKQQNARQSRRIHHETGGITYGSEIVYPIAEQSDEHGATGGAADSDDDKTGSRSPLLVRHESFGKSLPQAPIPSTSAHSGSTSSLDLRQNSSHRRVTNRFPQLVTSAASQEGLLEKDDSLVSDTPPQSALEGPRQDVELKSCEEDKLENLVPISTIATTSTTTTVATSSDAQCNTSLVGLDWLFEHTDSEPEFLSMIDTNHWNYTHSDDTDSINHGDNRKPHARSKESDSASSSTTLSIDAEMIKLFRDSDKIETSTGNTTIASTTTSWTTTTSTLSSFKPTQANEIIAKHQGAIPKQRRHGTYQRPPMNSVATNTTHSGISKKNCEDTTNTKGGEWERRKRKRDCEKSSSGNGDKWMYVSLRPNQFAVAPPGPLLDVDRVSEGNKVEGLECLVNPAANGWHRNLPTASNNINNNVNEASSSGSNNELSSLLPPAAPILAAFLAPRRELNSDNGHSNSASAGLNTPSGEIVHVQPRSRHRRLKRTNRMHRSRGAHRTSREASTTTSDINHPNNNSIPISTNVLPGTHLAKSHDDTTEGAVHCFRDEHGNWLSYTFDEKGTGTANANVKLLATLLRHQPDDTLSNSSASLNSAGLSMILDRSVKSGNSGSTNRQGSYYLEMPHSGGSNRLTCLIGSRQRHNTDIHCATNIISDILPETNTSQAACSIVETDTETPSFNHLHWVNASEDYIKTKKSRCYYNCKISPCTTIKVRLDRLALMALLDRNLSWPEASLAVLLASMVALLGGLLLRQGFYRDIFAFLFCFVVAGCQYSLLKSVQPDASSPTHGFNRIVAFSRPIYFCLCSLLVLLLDKQGLNNFPIKPTPLGLWGITIVGEDLARCSRDILINLLLFFPLIFSLGLFPQINTFSMYLLEQIDMHIFGGNATSSLVASFYCVIRSFLAVLFLYGFAFGGLSEPKNSQHILFSIFCGLLVATSFHLSRAASDPGPIWTIFKSHVWPLLDIDHPPRRKQNKKENDDINEQCPEIPSITTKEGQDNRISPEIESPMDKELEDPLPNKLQRTVEARLRSDIIVCGFLSIFIFAVHCSTVFTVLQPDLSPVLCCVAAAIGFLLHYICPQLRKQLPWLCLARPVLRSHEHEQFEVREAAKVMWFEKAYAYLCFFERNILYPVLFVAALTNDSPQVTKKFGVHWGTLIIVICGLKCLRGSYSDPATQYLVLIFAVLFFKLDYTVLSETFIVDYFLMEIIFSKLYEFLLKVQFVITYIAPWQITWGSAFHAFAQPFSVPHSAMLFLQAGISALLSTPLNPFLGSAIFLASYVRPIKFWERDYNTRRVDHSNTRLSSHLERNLGSDDNNLNSIFYEHLTRSLQHSLCGDLIMGRWGPVSQGDCFVLASDYLNCLVHIIELGNGLVTFQMRGLEFRGTYCQQREVEAISEGVEENEGFCCCEPGHLPHCLSANAAFSQRWLAWEVTATKYVLEGYSISDNSAVSMLQVFDFRKVLVTYYVKSIVFYCIRSNKLQEWLQSPTIQEALKLALDKNFVDLDPIFNMNIDDDYDYRAAGITRSSFCNVYLEWIQYCAEKQDASLEKSRDSPLVSLCFALSLLGRRALGAASHNTVSSVEFFLYGLHALFKGDFRITSARDEWIFSDVELLRRVVAPGVRMSLKLHQDHFMSPDEYEDPVTLYDAIVSYNEHMVISHEGDPAWRNAVLAGTPSLLALRHVLDDGADEYKVIMLNKRFLSFRVIKMNRECVRGLWAGQQQELVYLRNRNPERGSIQNAKQALRNIINSSCDQPIGYPIYVSPLTTSYAETNEQLVKVIGGPLSLSAFERAVRRLWRRARRRCREGCSSGGSGANTTAGHDDVNFSHEGIYALQCNVFYSSGTQTVDSQTGTQGRGGSLGSGIVVGGGGGGGSLGRANRGSLASVGKPSSATLASLAGLLSSDGKTENKEREAVCDSQAHDYDKEPLLHRVRIIDPTHVYDAINLGRRIDVIWPDERMRARGGRNHWKDWLPEKGMEGQVVHRWVPSHRDPNRRSHVDRTILLVRIEDRYVPIAESATQDLGAEV